MIFPMGGCDGLVPAAADEEDEDDEEDEEEEEVVCWAPPSSAAPAVSKDKSRRGVWRGEKTYNRGQYIRVCLRGDANHSVSYFQ